MRQNHTVNIVFPGTFSDLVEHLENKGVQLEAIVGGLVNSSTVVEIFPTDTTSQFQLQKEPYEDIIEEHKLSQELEK
jgi:hypothetical protein